MKLCSLIKVLLTLSLIHIETSPRMTFLGSRVIMKGMDDISGNNRKLWTCGRRMHLYLLVSESTSICHDASSASWWTLFILGFISVLIAHEDSLKETSQRNHRKGYSKSFLLPINRYRWFSHIIWTQDTWVNWFTAIRANTFIFYGDVSDLLYGDSSYRRWCWFQLFVRWKKHFWLTKSHQFFLAFFKGWMGNVQCLKWKRLTPNQIQMMEV